MQYAQKTVRLMSRSNASPDAGGVNCGEQSSESDMRGCRRVTQSLTCASVRAGGEEMRRTMEQTNTGLGRCAVCISITHPSEAALHRHSLIEHRMQMEQDKYRDERQHDNWGEDHSRDYRHNYGLRLASRRLSFCSLLAPGQSCA